MPGSRPAVAWPKAPYGAPTKTADDGTKLIAANRKARRNYEILETVEAGLVLRGSEVKSLREAQVQIGDAFARIEGGEVWLVSMHIGAVRARAAPLGPRARAAAQAAAAPVRDRPPARTSSTSSTSRSSRCRCTSRRGGPRSSWPSPGGARTYDKRQVLAERDADREAARAIARAGRGD